MNTTIAVTAAFLAIAAFQGAAQADTSIAQSQMQEPKTPEFSQAKLEAFVDAAQSVDLLVQKWRPRIQGAQNQEQARSLTEQANMELVGAIESTRGISVDEYRSINAAARNDTVLASRINKIFDERAEQ